MFIQSVITCKLQFKCVLWNDTVYRPATHSSVSVLRCHQVCINLVKVWKRKIPLMCVKNVTEKFHWVERTAVLYVAWKINGKSDYLKKGQTSVMRLVSLGFKSHLIFFLFWKKEKKKWNSTVASNKTWKMGVNNPQTFLFGCCLSSNCWYFLKDHFDCCHFF